jgi:hypothetical protein
MLFLPPNPSDPSDSTRPQFGPNSAYNTNPNDIQPDVYELDMVNDNVENQIVVAERPKMVDPNSKEPHNPRARTTVHAGRVRHNCNLRPVLNAAYMKQMKERTRKYNTPQRQIGRIEDAGISGGRGGINMLSSGVGVGSGTSFNSLVVSLQISFFRCVAPLMLRCRTRNRNQKRALSNVWRVCPRTNSSTSSSRSSARSLVGLSKCCARRRSSQNCISRKRCKRSRRSIGAGSIQACGS